MRPFHFYQTYHMASIVESSADYTSSFIEIGWEDSEVLECLARPSKLSLLHHYIFRSICVSKTTKYRDESDLIGIEEIEDLEAAFEAYQIKITSFQKFCKINGLSFLSDQFELGERFIEWFDLEFDTFAYLWEQITDEVFHILFGNRNFLLRFNSSLAKYLASGKVVIPPSYVSDKGHLKRCTHLPIWLKKAIYFRDQGRCVFCHKDLSGLLSTDRRLHYDHMVPLYLWGTNDPSNFQLLCEACNLKKSKKSASTSNRYTPWWEE